MDSRSSHSRSLAAAQLDHDQNLIVEGRDYQADAEQGHQSLSHQRHSDFAPLSFETSDSGSTASTSLSDIIEGLPTAVKSSLGPLMTIRRSVSIRGWVSYFYEISTNSTGTMGTTMSQHAEHHTVMSTSTTTEVEMQQQGQGYQSNQGQKRRRASVHGSTKTSSSTEMIEYVEPRRRGIDRFSALQGQILVNNALTQPPTTPGYSGDGIDRNGRRAYVQGVTWLLQGLPDDLESGERTDLIKALPNSLLDELSRTQRGSQRRLGPSPASASDRSMIQRVVAALVVQLMVPMQFLWAYILTLLTYAMQLERKYKVTEHVVKHSGELGYTVGKRGVKLSGAIYNNGGARVGAMVTDAAAYVADGLVKGIGDGIREACVDLRETEDR